MTEGGREGDDRREVERVMKGGREGRRQGVRWSEGGRVTEVG